MSNTLKYSVIFLFFLCLMIQTVDSCAQMRKTKEILKQEEKQKKEIEKFKKSKVNSVEYYDNDLRVGYSIFDVNGNCIENGKYLKEKKIPKNYFEYDSESNMIKQTNLNDDGTIGFYKKSIYDSLNQLIFLEESYPDLSISTKEIRKYDDRNNLSESEYLLNTGNLKYVFTYDENNNRTETKGYQNDTLNYIETLTYDGNKDLVEERKNFIPQGVIESSRFSYKYVERGNLLEFTKTSSDTVNTYTEKYEFDKNDNKISYASYNFKNKLEYRQSFRYDGNNNLIEMITFNKDNSLDRKEIFNYNESALLTKNIVLNPDSTIRSQMTKIYDLKGNVTEENTEENGNKNNYKYVYKYYE
ncbi:MAG TPA: hypothetical protein VIK14_08895 [Ignavibacteria bacterium]